MTSWAFWLIAAVLLGVAEMVTPTFFLFWFALGALAATATAFLGLQPVAQGLTFLVVSLLLLLNSKRLVKRLPGPNERLKSNAESLVGREAFVTEEIDNQAGSGRAKVYGVTWRAVSSDGQRIPCGERVTITAVESTRLIVSRFMADKEVTSEADR